MKEDIRVLANTVDTWEPLDKCPDKNGWYRISVKTFDLKTLESIEIISLGLFRDGEWLGEFRGDITGWTYPMRFQDDMLPNGKLRPVKSVEGCVQLAQKILEDSSRELTDAFECLISAKSARRYTDIIYRYLHANRIMSSCSIQAFSFGMAKQEDVVNTITARVLRKHGIKSSNTERVRKEIHGYIKAFLSERKKIPVKGESWLKAIEVDAWRKINSAVSAGGGGDLR